MNYDRDFIRFLVEAKQNTYAAGAKEVAPSRPQARDLPYCNGKYRYLDSYFGERNFLGQEVVWTNGQAAWGMNYYGEMLTDTIPENFSRCLKAALKAVPLDAPYRGPANFISGNLEYHCQWKGDMSSFHGEEVILEQGREIYRLKFHGGAVKNM